MTQYFTTLTQKGQATIPVSIRRMLKLKKGDRVGFILESGQVRLTRAGGVVARTAGVFKCSEPPMPAEALRQAAEEAIANDRGASESG